LREKLQNEKILSRKMVPRDIIQMLNMKPGELSEWVAADKSPVVPTPSNSDSTHPAEGLEGEYAVLARPLGRGIAETGYSDRTRQATFDRRFDQIARAPLGTCPAARRRAR
jgi:hypothetical protein